MDGPHAKQIEFSNGAARPSAPPPVSGHHFLQSVCFAVVTGLHACFPGAFSPPADKWIFSPQLTLPALTKLNILLPTHLAIMLLNSYLNELKTNMHIKTYTWASCRQTLEATQKSAMDEWVNSGGTSGYWNTTEPIKEMSDQTMNRHGGSGRTSSLEDFVSPCERSQSERLRIVWFQLHDKLEKAKIRRQ